MNWTQTQGFGGWSAALEQLIVGLADAFAAQNQTQKNAVLQNLRDFIKFSPNDVAGTLDDIALRTRARRGRPNLGGGHRQAGGSLVRADQAHETG